MASRSRDRPTRCKLVVNLKQARHLSFQHVVGFPARRFCVFVVPEPDIQGINSGRGKGSHHSNGNANMCSEDACPNEHTACHRIAIRLFRYFRFVLLLRIALMRSCLGLDEAA